MATNRTFTMIKPDGVENGHTGAILDKINSAGFRIVAMKKTQMTKTMQKHSMPFTMNVLFLES